MTEKETKPITINGKWGYGTLTAIGMLSLILNPTGLNAGICLSLALVFNPFGEKKAWKDFSLGQKAILLGQLMLSMAAIAWAMYCIIRD